MIEPLMLAALIADDFKRILGRDLTGVYVHGSLAFGGCRRENTDLDILAVTEREPARAEKESMLFSVLEHEKDAPGKGIELTVVTAPSCKLYKHPGEYCLRYSAKNRYEATREAAAFVERSRGTDPVLAIHYTVCRTSGLTMLGIPAKQLFAGVSEADFIDGIRCLMEDLEGDIRKAPAATILHFCRCLAFAEGGVLCSKSQGGRWALVNTEDREQELIHEALLAHWAGEEMEVPDDIELFLIHMRGRIKAALDERMEMETKPETEKNA